MVDRDGLGVKIGLDPHRPTRTGPVFAITASALLMHANSVADVMLSSSTFNASAHCALANYFERFERVSAQWGLAA